MEGLDPISVTRSVPVIYILISQDPLREDEDGYQVYNHRDPKKVLNLQLVEESETKQGEVADNLNNSNSDNGDQKDNISEDALNTDFNDLSLHQQQHR